MTPEEKTAFALSTIRPMAEYTIPYVASILGVLEEGKKGEHVGSALRCVLGGKRALVTAWHVIDKAMSYPCFAVSAGYGNVPYVISGEIHYAAEETLDLAVYYLPDDYPPAGTGMSFWPEDRIALSRDRLTTDYLFLQGFPRMHSAYSLERTGLVSISLPYGTMQRIDSLPADLRPSQFALDFDDQYIRVDDSAPQKLPDPHGLSGCPVWRIGASGRPAKEWTPEWSLLVGIATQWRPPEKILIATDANRILEVSSRPEVADTAPMPGRA